MANRFGDFCAYYRRLGGVLAGELWGTWRTEAWPTMLIAALICITSYKNDTNALTAFTYVLESCGIYLLGWGFYHLVRAPWKLSLDATSAMRLHQQQRSFRLEWRELGADFESNHIVGDARWFTKCGVVDWSINSEKLIALCTVAGSKLIKSPQLSQTLSKSVLSESDPMKRWLIYVREHMPRAWAKNQMDWQTAHLSIPNEGEIRSIANTSALVCIKCSAEEE